MMTRKLYLTISVLLLAIFALIYMLYKADLSLQPLKSETLTDKKDRPPVYLISYADGHEVFYKNQHMLTYSAQNKGFDFFLNYRKSLLDPVFVKENQDILKISTGGGLWLWKPQIILQTMRHSPKNALIVYTDVGYIYGKPIDGLFDLMKEKDVLLHNLDNHESKEKLTQWLPKKIAEEWGIINNPPPFIESGFIIVRNTEKAKIFMERWLEICANRDYAFLSYDTAVDNIKGFTYDQSLLSLVAHRYPNDVQIVDKDKIMPFLLKPHRHPGCNLPVLLAYVIPLPLANDIVWVIRKIRAFYRMLVQ